MFGIGLARRIRSRVADSPFSRGVTQLALATLAGQAIILMAIPLLTRLYDPASFGVAGVFSSITAIFYPLSSLRYELAIPLPKPDEDAANLLVLSLLLLLPTALLVAVLMWFIGPALANLTHSPEIESYLWVVPVGLFGVGALQAVISWAVRIRDYTAVARARIEQGVGLVLVQVGGGLAFDPTVPWLVGGQLAGQSVGLVSVSRDAWARSRDLRHSVTRNRLWEMARRYKRFPQVSVVSGLVDSLALFLPGRAARGYVWSGTGWQLLRGDAESWDSRWLWSDTRSLRCISARRHALFGVRRMSSSASTTERSADCSCSGPCQPWRSESLHRSSPMGFRPWLVRGRPFHAPSRSFVRLRSRGKSCFVDPRDHRTARSRSRLGYVARGTRGRKHRRPL